MPSPRQPPGACGLLLLRGTGIAHTRPPQATRAQSCCLQTWAWLLCEGLLRVRAGALFQEWMLMGRVAQVRTDHLTQTRVSTQSGTNPVLVSSAAPHTGL